MVYKPASSLRYRVDQFGGREGTKYGFAVHKFVDVARTY